MPTTFAKLMDTLSEDLLEKKSVGAVIEGKLIPALLFVDDVASVTEGERDEEGMLDEVAEFAVKHKMEWGIDKCKVLEVGRHRNPRKEWKLGEKIIESAEDYKYLGDIIQRNGTNGKNLEARKQKVMKAMRAVKSCARNEIMRKIENQIILRLHDAVIVPTILTNSESWTLTKSDELFCDKIETFALKKMLWLPLTFPMAALICMTGTLYTSVRMDLKRFLFLHKILRREDEHWTTHMLHALDKTKTGWSAKMREKLVDYRLETDWEKIKEKHESIWKAQVKKVTEKKNKELLLDECYKNNGEGIKMKTESLIEILSDNDYVRAPSNIIMKMERDKARIILIARFRMLDCANNYSQKYGTKNCDKCLKTDDENHRINRCEKERIQEREWIEFDCIYEDNGETLKNMVQVIAQTWGVKYQ